MTGSFHTMVTQGLATRVISSGVRVGSTSTGLAADTRPWWHSDGVVTRTAALLTDHYELTMLQAALAAGTADRRVGLRAVPAAAPRGPSVRRGGRRRAGRWTRSRRSGSTTRRSRRCASGEVVDEPTLAWLADYRFAGDIWGYAEGEVYFPYSPLLVVEATFAEAVLLETVLLSIYNHDSAIASAASRMTMVAGDRPCIEMGSRRTHEEAAVASARAAYVAGFASSSNLAARQRYGVPTAGTSAHSFTLLHDTEADAFRAQVASLGTGTTLLVDTYDVAEAVRLGVEVAGTGARRGPARQRRPRRAGARRSASSSTGSARPTPGSW